MTSEKRAAAIAWLQDEIRSLQLAPTINGCDMKPEWVEQMEIMETCLEAVKVCSVDVNKTSPLTLDRLRELLEADRDGRCVVLWAAPGTKVFEIAKTCSCGGYEEKFKYFPCYSDCVSCCEECDASRAVNERMLLSFELKTPPYGLGKTVFLTREAAESALKGERDEQVP